MKRNKYVNTFNTTSEFNNYIESAEPGFPNVALTKDDGNVHYTQTSPNDHVIYGEVVDVNGTIPVFRFNEKNNQKVTAHIDTANGTFYIDASDMIGISQPLTSIAQICRNQTNIKSLLKFNVQMNAIPSLNYSFYHVPIVVLDLSQVKMTDSATNANCFDSVTTLTDIFINDETTLMKLTKNLSSHDDQNYIPSSATIHYNGTDYKWQNNAWTPQS